MMNREIKVGLFVTIGLVLLYIGFQYLKGKNFFSSVGIYYVQYDNIDKLSVSDRVFINGFAVGRVSDINLDEKSNLVNVELEIRSDVVLGDSTVAMLTSDVLGNKSINLDIRKVNGNLAENSTMKGAVQLGMMAKFSENAQPVAANLQTTLQKLGLVLDNLNENGEHLKIVLKRMEKTPVILNSTLLGVNDSFGALSKEWELVGVNLNKTLLELKPTLKNIETLSDSLKRLHLGETLSKLQTTMDNVNTTLTKLTKNDNTAGRLLNEDSLYVNLNTMLLRIDTLANNLNRYPKQFFSPFGKKAEKVAKERKQYQQ